MKKFLNLLMFAFFALISINASAASFIPDEIRQKGDGYYYELSIFENNDYAAFYMDNAEISYNVRFVNDCEKIIVLISNDSGTVYLKEYEDDGNECFDSVDISGKADGEYRFAAINYFPDNTANYLFDLKLVKNGDDVKYKLSEYYEQNKRYVKCFKDLEPEVIEYYKTDYIQALDEATYEMFKKLSDEITADMKSDHDKAYAIYEWVCSNIYYDMDAFNSGSIANGCDAVITLTDRKGVCGGYAMITQYLMQMAGIPSRYVSGTGTEPTCSLGHAWNYIYIDEKWSFVDTTWGSRNIYENGTGVSKDFTSMQFGITEQFLSITRRCDFSMEDTGYMDRVLLDDVLYSRVYWPTLGKYTYDVDSCENIVRRDIVIRSSLYGIPVTRISEKAFNEDNVRNVYIPASVETVEENAFYKMNDFTIYFLGDSTEPHAYFLDYCKNFTICASTKSYVYNFKSSRWGNVKNTDWYFENLEYKNNGLNVNIKNGLLLKQPRLMVAVYDYNGKLCEIMSCVTTADCEQYSFDTAAYGPSNTVKTFLVSQDNIVFPYCKGNYMRLADTETVDKVFESYHTYDNNFDETQEYKYTGSCHSIDVTFTEGTQTESDADFIIIYDGNDNEIGKFSGKELSGKTVNVLGNTVKIRLLTNEKNRNYYGYKTEKIVVNLNKQENLI